MCSLTYVGSSTQLSAKNHPFLDFKHVLVHEDEHIESFLVAVLIVICVALPVPVPFDSLNVFIP